MSATHGHSSSTTGGWRGFTPTVRSEMIKFAILCKASSSRVDQRRQVLDQFPTLDVQMLPEYSNEDVMCVRDQQTGSTILAIRGTDNRNKTGNRLRDVISDLFILINRKELMPRLVEIEKLVERLIQRYGKDRVGHSLGGFLAVSVAEDLGVKAKVFNVGSSPFNGGWRGFTPTDNKNITVFTTNDPFKLLIDPLSITSTLRDDYKTYRVPKKENIGIHSIDNFLPDEKV